MWALAFLVILNFLIGLIVYLEMVGASNLNKADILKVIIFSNIGLIGIVWINARSSGRSRRKTPNTQVEN